MQETMEGEEGGTIVRRTARARKVNPRFVGDDIDENYMKMVGRITASNYSKKPDDLKDVNGGDPSVDPLMLDPKQSGNESALSDCENEHKVSINKGSGGQNFIAMLSNSKSNPIKNNSDSSTSSLNIALKTVSLKKIKKAKSFTGGETDVSVDPKGNPLKSSASIIVRCRSSTESEESIESDADRKRKLDYLIQNNADYKKLKTRRCSSEILDAADKSVEVNDTGIASANLRAAPLSAHMAASDPNNQSNSNVCKDAFSSPVQSAPKTGPSNTGSPFQTVLKKAFVSFSSKIEQTQPKILLTSKSRFNLPGKKLKIVSLKPLTNLKEGSLESKSDSNSEMVLAKGGLVELKIIKKDTLPLSGSNFPSPFGKPKSDIKLALKVPVPVQELKSKDSGKDSKNSSNLFSSDGEDDIPLNKLIEKKVVTKKKKKMLPKDLQLQKRKIKKNKLKKFVSKKKSNDQDDLPLKLLIKKPKKNLSKNFTDKVKKAANKSHTSNPGDSSIKKLMMKVPGVGPPKSKSKSVVGVPVKKKKIKMLTQDSDDRPPSAKLKEAKMKRFKNMKSKISDSKLLGLKNKISPLLNNKKLNKGNSKKINKLRFKFPQKKSIKKDVPLAKETTNIVISVSGVEGDYACLAIDKDHISTQNDVSKTPSSVKEEADSPQIKSKNKNGKFASSKKYTFDSGLVLEEDVSEFSGNNKFAMTKEPKVKKPKSSSNITAEGDSLSETLKTPNKDSKVSKSSILKRESSLETPGNKRPKEKSLERKDSSNSIKGLSEKSENKKENIKVEDSIKELRIYFANPSQPIPGQDKYKNNDVSKVRTSITTNNNDVKVNLDSPRVDKKPRFRNLDKAETKGESEHRRSKEKERHREEKIKKEKHSHSDKTKSKDDKEGKKHRDKHHKSDKKDKIEGVKVEETSFKKEKSDGKGDKIMQKFEKESASNKLDTSLKKVEKENSHALATKVKKKENFEEALLSVPLVKLPSKHKIIDGLKGHDKKKDKEAKKSHKDKEMKQEVVDNTKHHHSKEHSKAKESSISPSKSKSDSHSIKKEEKHKHKEERRHSSSSSRSDDRRKDRKDGSKPDLDSSYNDKDQKHRREDKERRHSSHKKHKRDHSDSHRKRSHSTSEERKPSKEAISKDLKKAKTEDNSELNVKGHNDFDLGEKNKGIKFEDNKDIIINKIIDSEKEQPENIKQERVSTTSEKDRKGTNRSLPMQPLVPTKTETKPELVIDEEYLINTNKLHLKEETYNDVVSVESNSPLISVKNEVGQDLQTALEEQTSRASTSHSKVKQESNSNNIVNKSLTKEERGLLGSSLQKEGSNDEVNDDLKVDKRDLSIVEEREVDNSFVSEMNRSYDVNKADLDISDLGILDELKQFEKIDMEKRQKKEREELKHNEPIVESITQIVPSPEKKVDLSSVTSLDLESSNKSDLTPSMESASNVSNEQDVKMVSETQNESSVSTVSLGLGSDSKVEAMNKAPKTMKAEEESLSIDEKNNTETDCTNSTSLIDSEVVSKVSCKEEDKSTSVEEKESPDKSKQTALDCVSERLSQASDTKETEQLVIATSDKLITLISIPLPIEAGSPICNESKEPMDTKITVSTDVIEPSVVDPNPLLLDMEEISDDSDETLSTPIKIDDVLDDEKENLVPKDVCQEMPVSETPLEEDVKAVEVEKELTPEEKEEMEKRNKKIVEERLKSFEHLQENLYLIEKVKNKRSKEAKRMVCDCTLTKEEVSNDEMGCGDDCLNKLLMIECGSRCPLRDRCTNKKFQQKTYADVDVFNADMKGCGVKARDDITTGTFIMEYMGEVFDTKEFKRRRKEYAKGSSAHFYFMALRSDRLIDATRKGNISRFINHSCSPNAETQKWTVNGDIRIGFFATRTIPVGEEINFDYRLERYGREPQKCYCGTPECRGWLGEPPDQKTKEEKEEDRRKALKDRQRREGKRSYFEDMDLEDEIEKLTSRGLRNRQDTLNLSRLMVRCEDSASRLSLLKILEAGEEASKRLFLDYHGLKLLWSWMVDISSSHKCGLLKLEILKTLNCLPITNKTQITDSKIINIVERWSKTESKVEKEECDKIQEVPKESSSDKKLSDGSEDSDTETSEAKDSDPSPTDTVSPDDSSLDSNLEAASSGSAAGVAKKDEESEASEETATATATSVAVAVVAETAAANETPEIPVPELASNLLELWSDLKEAFRIPKTERIEMMKEHERQVDKEYAKYLDKKMGGIGDRTQAFYDRWRYSSVDKEKERQERERRREKWRTRRKEEDDDKGLSKEERRERFAKQVAKEDEEARQRKLQEEMWTLHLERCTLLGHDPYFTPIFDPTGQYYWDPGANGWQAYIGPSGNLPVPASYGMTQPDSLESVCPAMPLNQMFMPDSFYSLPHTPLSDEEGQQQPQLVEMPDADAPLSLDLASIPLPGEPPLPPTSPPTATSAVVAIPLPGEDDSMDVEPMNGVDACGSPMPPLAPPGPVTIQLPSKWKMARDMDRRIYFYHTKTRHSQWDLPTDDLHVQLLNRYGLNSDSESDLESDSDSTSSSDSEDFSSDEDENEEEEAEDPLVQTSEGVDEKMIRRPKGKKVRSEKLVQERVISPILFEDREAARKERKEAKERAREEARKERWQLLKAHRAARAMEAEAGNNSHLSEDTVASPNDNEDDEHLEEQLVKFSRKKSEGKSHVKGKSKERAATAMADTSDLARKIKDNFRSRMATYIVSVLNPYRKPDCKEGRITCNDDFKYLARKLTHFVMVKELKQLPSIDGLDCSESVKHKTKEFVRKYMERKCGGVFKRDPNDTKEYREF